MAWLDGALLAILFSSMLLGICRGLVKESLSLANWIVSFWLSLVFCEDLSSILTPYISIPQLRIFIAFVGAFFILLLIGHLVSYFITKFVRSAPFSGTDRFLGGVFGLARGVLLSLGLVFLAGLSTLPHEAAWQQAFMAPKLEDLAIRIQKHLPHSVAEHFDFKEIIKEKT